MTVKVHAVSGRGGIAVTWLECSDCYGWMKTFDKHEVPVHDLNDIALRHEASVEHLLRVMGSVR